MDDPDAWRDNAQSLVGLLRPFQKPVALIVAFELAAQVALHGSRVAPIIDLQGVVHDQVHGNPRVDLRGVAARLGHGVAQGGQVLQHRQAAGIGQDHPRHVQGQIRPGVPPPVPQPADFLFGNGGAPGAVPQEVLQQYSDDIGIRLDVAAFGPGGGGQVRVAQRSAATGERLDHGSGNRENLN
ncbi:hypothetical protein D3C85_1229460 [compost metagenome]